MRRIELAPVQISFLVIIWLLSGCSAFEARGTKTAVLFTKNPLNERTLSPKNKTPISTDTIVPSLTHFPSIASESIKPVISYTLAEAKSTWTPLATLSKADSARLIKKLLVENPDCHLPCWWGIIPGLTKEKEATQFLESFTTLGNSYGNSFTFEYSTLSGVSSGFTLFIRNSMVWLTRIHPESTRYNYQVDQLLKNYGEPNEVLIWTMASAPFQPIPFILVLDYHQYQFKAIFDLTVEKEGDFLKSCPKSVGPWLYIWDLNDPTSLDWIEENAYGVDRIDLKRIEDVTSMNIKDFKSTFINPGACITTPIVNW